MVRVLSVQAPVSGVVQEVRVGEGEDVSQDMLLLVQGSSKTETQVSSPVAGKVKYVAKTGNSLEKGELLAEIEY